MYSARTPGGGTHRFGTSGLLCRSNKLMYDRATFTLWSNLTGEAVLGRLAASAVRLAMRAVTLTSWGDWRKRHPDTTVVKLDPSYGARWRFDYSPGAADKARAGVGFPVWPKSGLLDGKQEVLGLGVDGATKAYPVDRLLAEGVVNDSVGGVGVVLVADRASETVRAYQRRDRRFARRSDGELVDEAGRVWRIEEAALVPAPAPRGETARAATGGGTSSTPCRSCGLLVRLVRLSSRDRASARTGVNPDQGSTPSARARVHAADGFPLGQILGLVPNRVQARADRRRPT